MFPIVVFTAAMWVSLSGDQYSFISSHLILLHIVHTGVEDGAQVRQVEYRQGAKRYVNDVDP